MRPRLLFVDRDLELRVRPTYRDVDASDSHEVQSGRPPPEAAAKRDLELDVILGAMAAGDPYLLKVATAVLPVGLSAPEPILYRQRVVADCLRSPEVIREVYGLAVQAIESERGLWLGVAGRYPESILHRSIELLKLLLPKLRRLRVIAEEQREKFQSDGIQAFLAMLIRELNEEYLQLLEAHVQQLQLRQGILISAQLGQGNKGTHYMLRRPREPTGTWLQRLLSRLNVPDTQASSLVYQVAERDESGMQALADLHRRGISSVARALAQSTDHLLSFFWSLRSELGFLVGCLNLRDRLAQKGEPICLPQPSPSDSPMLHAQDLYDVSLSLSMPQRVVGNELAADGKSLLMITGANHGGKSTLLRAIGQAQVMMQAGIFVAASAFRANVCARVFTHFKREEDVTLRSGKLEEELRRMSDIVQRLTSSSMVLLNESLASTNEREGSEIARQIVQALLDRRVKVICVTHLFDLAQNFYEKRAPEFLFLRAERRRDGTRTFRIQESEPLATSHGADIFRQIFEPGIPWGSGAGQKQSEQASPGSVV